MKKKDNAVEALETWASDDLNLLDFATPRDFQSEDLYKMLWRLEWKITRLERWQRLNMYFAASAVLWLLIAIIAFLVDYRTVSIIALRLFPVSIVVFLIISVWIQQKMGTLGAFYAQRDLIKEELQLRSLRLGTRAHDLEF